MRKIIVLEHISLDGVIQAPVGMRKILKVDSLMAALLKMKKLDIEILKKA